MEEKKMDNEYYYILSLINSNFFDCVEDGIDFIIAYYNNGKLSLEQRNKLINAL